MTALSRILVVEKSATVSLMIASLLRRWGYDVQRADEATLAVEPFDLLIAEPTPHSARLAELCRSVRAGGAAWLALMSESVTKSAADADGWAHKPVRAEELRDAIERCLARRAGAGESAGIDHALVASFWSGVDDPIYRRVARVFLAEMTARLDIIGAALHSVDRRRLTVEAHSTGSAAENVGARFIAEAGRALERAAPDAEWAQVQAAAHHLRRCSERDLPALRELVGEA